MSAAPWIANAGSGKTKEELANEKVPIEHSVEVINSCIAYLAKELDPDAFLKESYGADPYHCKPALRLMADRRVVATQKAKELVGAIMMTMDRDYALFYESKFRRA